MDDSHDSQNGNTNQADSVESIESIDSGEFAESAQDIGLKDLEKVLGVSIRDKNLFNRALTHASVAGEKNYERLEFLGDRVLGLAMADLLYITFPQEAEGALAKRHAALVQGVTLASIAQELDLGRFVTFSEAERQSGGAANENILADCLEALLGALYLDQGFATCEDLIRRLWGERLMTQTRVPQDPKTELQEWAQGNGLPLPHYEIVGRQGPDHAPIFQICLKVKTVDDVLATGSSRRAAEKAAAKLMLDKISAR